MKEEIERSLREIDEVISTHAKGQDGEKDGKAQRRAVSTTLISHTGPATVLASGGPVGTWYGLPVSGGVRPERKELNQS